LAQAQRRVDETERNLAAERAHGVRAREELETRAQRAESALAEARATGERTAVAAKRADAAAELARVRADGLEAALTSAREVAAQSGRELEQARGEIATLRRDLETSKTENEAAREAVRIATEQLERERRERARAAAAGAVSAPAPPAVPAPEPRAVPAPAPRAVPEPEPAPARPLPGPAWSHGAQRALAASLIEATEWRSGLKEAVRILGSEGGWDAVVAWCPDERGTALRCMAMWMAAPDQHALFETATWQRRLSPTASEVGRAAAGDRARWLGDLASAEDPQLVAASREGLGATLLVPIGHGGETSGALEFLTRETTGGLAPETVSALEAVALQLAHFDHLLRRGAEPRWRLGRL
jgi:hypothetical protein